MVLIYKKFQIYIVFLVIEYLAQLMLYEWDSKDRLNGLRRIFGNILGKVLLFITQFSSASLSLNFKMFNFFKRVPVQAFLFWKNISLSAFLKNMQSFNLWRTSQLNQWSIDVIQKLNDTLILKELRNDKRKLFLCPSQK